MFVVYCVSATWTKAAMEKAPLTNMSARTNTQVPFLQDATWPQDEKM